MTPARSALLAAIVSLAALACGTTVDGEGTSATGTGGAGGAGGTGGAGPTPACETPPDAMVFELGSGELCFERIEPLATVPQYNGPQGGYHLFLAVGCTDCGASALLEYTILDRATGEPLARTAPLTQVYLELPAGAWPQVAGVQVGMPGVEYLTDEPPVPEGTELAIDVKLRDASGTTLLHEGRLEVTVGATQAWDPCDAHPDGPCCKPDDMCLGNG